MIDPASINQQGSEQGIQYHREIYYINPADNTIITHALTELQTHYTKPIAIENKALVHFFPAEEYHQNYLVKNPDGYCSIDTQLMNNLLSKS